MLVVTALTLSNLFILMQAEPARCFGECMGTKGRLADCKGIVNKGTCRDVEKKFSRLTGPPNPSKGCE